MLKTKQYSKQYYKKNKVYLRRKRIKYYYENHKLERERRMKYYYNNLDKELSDINREKRKKYRAEYRKVLENKVKMNKYQRRKLKEDREYWIKSNLRTRLNHAINYYRKKGVIVKSRSGLINYEKVIKHLQPFPKDIRAYHVDHIIPLCSFDLTKPKEIKKAFASENLQWLKAEENLKKGKKLNEFKSPSI